jgi:hypothetical protein
MQNTQITIRFIEDLFAIRFALRILLIPMNRDFLLRVSLNFRDPHPDARLASSRIPMLNLISQRFALHRETHITSFGCSSFKIEKIAMKSQ